MTYTIDRIENGSWVVLETASGETIDVPREWMPAGVSEGDVLQFEIEQDEGQSTIRIVIDDEEAARRRARMQEKRNRLRRGPSGNLHL